MFRVPCLALLLLVLASGLAPAEIIPLRSPGLETDTNNRGVPDGWDKYVIAFGSAKTSIDSTVKHGGADSLRIDLGEKSRCAISQYVKVNQPGAYTFGGWLKSQPPHTTVAQVAIQWFKIIEWPLQIQWVRADAPSPFIASAEDWTKVGAVGTKPDDADLALVVIVIGNGKTPAGTFWADDAYFETGAHPAPLVNNPSFELRNQPNGLPDGWGIGGVGGGFEVQCDAQVAHTGKASARLTGLQGHGDRVCLVQDTPVFPTPKTLRITLWYKGTGQADGVIDVLTPPGVRAADGGPYWDRYNFTCPTPKEDWTQIVIEKETTVEARKAGLMRMGFLLYQKGEGSVWYDDVGVELGE